MVKVKIMYYDATSYTGQMPIEKQIENAFICRRLILTSCFVFFFRKIEKFRADAV